MFPPQNPLGYVRQDEYWPEDSPEYKVRSIVESLPKNFKTSSAVHSHLSYQFRAWRLLRLCSSFHFFDKHYEFRLAMQLKIAKSHPGKSYQAICSTGSGRFVASTKASSSGKCASCSDQEASGKVKKISSPEHYVRLPLSYNLANYGCGFTIRPSELL